MDQSQIIAISGELPLVCCICHGRRYTEDTGGNKITCNACAGDYIERTKTQEIKTDD